MNSIACVRQSIFVIQHDGHCLSEFQRDDLSASKPFRPDLSIGERIAHIACGSNYAMAFSTKGNLWALGSNGRGQLGLGDTKSRGYFTSVDTRSLIKDGGIAGLDCGDLHTALVTNKGHLWVAGDNRFGQLGLRDSEGCRNFVQVSLPGLIEGESIAQVFCGHNHTILLTNKGHLWGVGINDNGQLGLGNVRGKSQFIQIPVRNLAEDESIARVACGSEYTILLTTKGHLWAAGYNYRGQLGLRSQDATHYIRTFTHSPISRLMKDEGIAKVACGFGPPLFLTNKGNLWAALHSAEGELSGFTAISTSSLIKGEGIADIPCSRSTILLTTRGRLVVMRARWWNSYVYELVSAGYLIRSPLFGKTERFTTSSNCLSDEYAELIKTVLQYPSWFRQHVNKKETTSSLLSISAVIRKEWSRLTLGTMPEETKISYLQLFCWLRLSILDPALANSLRTNLRLNSEDYLVAEGSLSQEGVLINRYSNSAHEPVSIYHLPILLEGQEAIVLSMSPIIIITAEEERYDTRCIPAPPLQLLDLPEDVLGMILNYLQPVSVVKLMNTCKTVLPAIDRHLIKPLALRLIPDEYAQARATIEAPYSLETIKHIDALLQDIFTKTGDERIFYLKKLLLAGQVSCFCLLDLHQRVCTSDETNPSLPSPNIAGFSFAPSRRKNRIGWF